MMKLVEEISGDGELLRNGVPIRRVPYRISRRQGIVESSGLPVPGLHRIEGRIGQGSTDFQELVGIPLALKLEDGRVFGISLITRDGRILSEGHGPSRCLCC